MNIMERYLHIALVLFSIFISKDGKEAWLLYSGNFSDSWNGLELKENPPGSHYGMVFQKIQLLD